jgi:hypothetical protein
MKMLLKVVFPTEPFNSFVKKGTAGKTLEKIMGELKPQEAHFTLSDGKRCLLMVININNPGDYVKYAEPFFLQFNAGIKYEITMSPEELKAAGLEELGKKYA